MPKRNARFWREKFEANRERDARKIRELRRAKYKVIVVWQCEADNRALLRARLSNLRKARCVDALQTIDHRSVMIGILLLGSRWFGMQPYR